MSISYCGWCERIIEGRTIIDDTGEPACPDCGEEVTELSEDTPDPSLDKFRQVADRIGDK